MPGPIRCSPRIIVANGIETGTIGTRDLICPAWGCFNIEDLLSLTLRHNNYLAPGSDGRVARPIKIDQHTASLRFFMDGVQDRNGVDHPDETAGLEINRRDFIDNIVRPPGTATDTRTAAITLADGSNYTAPVQTTSFQFRYTQIPGIARVVIDVTIPSGELVAV